MSLTAYFQRYILGPAGMNNTYYWVGGQGLEPGGIRRGVVSLPSYVTTFASQGPGGAAPLAAGFCLNMLEPS
jgi:CubicO group peptidase (beta-lactamase class C family)